MSVAKEDQEVPMPKPSRGFSSRFFVHRNNVAQNMVGPGVVVVQYTTETFDGNNEFDNAVNFCFQPREPGYYYLYAVNRFFPTMLAAPSAIQIQLRNIGVGLLALKYKLCDGSNIQWIDVSGIFYLVPTDRIEVEFGTTAAGAAVIDGALLANYFCGHKLSE